MRPSDRVHQGRGLPVDSQMTIQRGEDVQIMNRPGGHFSGVAISAADDLARQPNLDLGSMIAILESRMANSLRSG
jgi:hypothetical protein